MRRGEGFNIMSCHTRQLESRIATLQARVVAQNEEIVNLRAFVERVEEMTGELEGMVPALAGRRKL